ncbi:serine hydrolase [Paenibacillus filicis]|uniref:Serine hydrolase n=1 Tax=Paenibacillus gyeongsangnamensis TaxID=3388067 RepID=A0ABT4QL47_9BACL|nr:serine hydrolase domain-containing protein [Paenibacillus filicis]MCZ8517431.1 serine hydrolase [Paenibacillus filicis]
MSDRSWSIFEAYVGKLMKQESIAGAAVAVSQHGEIIYQKGFGVRDIETKDPVTPDTIFGTASVTKSFTALAIMQLADEGKLSLDDPVIRYIPEFKLHGLEDTASVKIHHLLSHTTGLPPMRRNEVLNRLNDHPAYMASESYELLGKPGQYFSYCNDTFLLLGTIIEQLTGRLYRRYMTERILERLHMHRSTFSFEELAKYDRVSIPYVKNSETGVLEEVPWPMLGNYEVGGGIRSNVLDLLKYGQCYVDGGMVQGRSIVSQDAIHNMWKPVHRVGRNTFYGYALRITPDYSGVSLVEHGGAQPGVSSHFGFVPEEGLVAVVLTNVANVPANDMWLAAVNTALGFPLEQKSSIEPHAQASLEHLQSFVGTYRSAEGGCVSIFLDDQKPKAEIDGKVFTLRASTDSTLVIENKEYPIRFFFKDGPKAWAAFYGSRMLTRVKPD